MRTYDFEDLAGRLGFDMRDVEKVCRISDVLGDLSAVRFLRNRLSLYGGSALAFIHSKEVTRLSVDLDLNYRHVGGKDWGEVRSEIDERIKVLLYRRGYGRADIAISPSYPLARFTVGYGNAQGHRDSFRIEVGYMRRCPILKNDMLAEFRHLGTGETFLTKTPRREELFANKWCTLLYRKTPRDLFDVYQIASHEINSEIFRKCAVVDSLMRARRKLYEIDASELIKRIPIDSSLRNLLQTENVSTYDFDEMKEEVIQFTESMIANLTENEVSAIDEFFEAKKFKPEVIDAEGIFNEAIGEHPSIRWALSNLLS